MANANERKEGQALVDSLEQGLHDKAIADSSRVDVLARLAYEYRNLVPAKAISFANEAEQLAKKVHREQKLGEIYFVLAFAHKFYQDLIKSYEYSLMSLQYCERYNISDILPLAKMSLLFNNPNISNEEIQHIIRDIPADLEKVKNVEWYIRAVGLFGTYYMGKDLKKADSLCSLAIELSRKNKMKFQEVHNLIRLSSKYTVLGQFDSGIQIKVKQIQYLKAIGEKRILSESYGAIADEWISWYQSEHHSGFLDSAQVYAQHELNTAMGIDYGTKMIDGYLHLYTIAKYQGKFREALSLYEKARDLEQGSTGLEAQKKMVGIALKERDKTASMKLKGKEAEIKRQRIYTLSGLGGIILTGLLLFFVYRNYQTQRKANALIEQANQELKETQDQLVQQEKLASLGALTAGIAHEIKNPLNFVNNFADLSYELFGELKTAESEEEKQEIMATLQQNLSKIKEHGKRADEIVKSMLEHSRSGIAEKQLTDINKLCDEFMNLAYHGMRASARDFNCTMEKRLSADLPKIKVVQQDISRVLLNLINNAFYAIKDKPDGVITVATTATSAAVVITVRDNGTGIPKEVRKRIFEPFFTTKPSGSGTGLGLSLSFDIVKAHGGTIELQSEEGSGTEFIVTLPIKA